MSESANNHEHPSTGIWTILPPASVTTTAKTLSKSFTGDINDEIVVFFVSSLRKGEPVGRIPLDRIIRHLAQVPVQAPMEKGGPSTLRIPTSKLFDILGMIRAVKYDLDRFHQGTLSPKSAEHRNERWYDLFRLTRQAREWGISLMDNAADQALEIPGLDSLLAFLEEKYASVRASAQDTIAQGVVDFDSFHELFRPGNLLIDTGLVTGIHHTNLLLRSRASCYRRNKTATGKIVSTFEASLEFMVNVGPGIYALTEARYIQQEFSGTRSVSTRDRHTAGSDVLAVPSQTTIQALTKRGEYYQTIGQKAMLVDYQTDSFYTPQPSRVSGRLMVDTAEAWSHGCHSAKAPADGMGGDAIMAAYQAFARWKRLQEKSHERKEGGDGGGGNFMGAAEDEILQGDILLIHGPIPTAAIACTWPIICGFSFSSRKWGLALVDSLSAVHFHEEAFDALVLPAPRKRLLKALVLSHSKNSKRADLLPGKGEGIIFLLHGPPGCGKTLTAEAVSEVLHLPLYRVSMGELGTSPESLELRLQEIFDICAPWNAMVLIDEAEMLLEDRSASTDLVRNAMVCVMLRLLEYYPGILFLTTNVGLDSLDPAVASRLTCTLGYDALDAAGRASVWQSSLVSRLGQCPINADDLEQLSIDFGSINGRQIKNAVQLAVALCEFEDTPVTTESLRETLSITSFQVQS